METLSLARLADIAREDIREVKRVDTSKKGIKSLDDLSACVELEKLDLSHNSLTSLEGIADCRNLKWLNVAYNELEQLTDLKHLTCLKVLNASMNSIKSLQPLTKLKALQALVLSSNDIAAANGIESLVQLNTLVLSKNRLESVAVLRLTSLEKLSLSHNGFRAFPDISALHSLKELRLNDNKIMQIPDSICMNARLVILDLGNNRFRDFEALQPLGSLKLMANLNLKGNVVSTTDNYVDKVVSVVRGVKILDGKPLSVDPPAGHVDKSIDNPRNCNRDVAAQKQPGKQPQTKDTGEGTVLLQLGDGRSTHSASRRDEKVKTVLSKGRKRKVISSGTDCVDSLAKQSDEQAEQGASVHAKLIGHTRKEETREQVKRSKEGLEFNDNNDWKKKPLRNEKKKQSGRDKETIDSKTPRTVSQECGPSVQETSGSRQSRKQRKEGEEITDLEPKQKKRKLAKKECNEGNPKDSRTDTGARVHKARRFAQKKGRPALKARDSGVVAIKEVRRKLGHSKSKSSTFKPDLLLQSIDDFGVGGTSAW